MQTSSKIKRYNILCTMYNSTTYSTMSSKDTLVLQGGTLFETSRKCMSKNIKCNILVVG